jgi:hypothetical protein
MGILAAASTCQIPRQSGQRQRKSHVGSTMAERLAAVQGEEPGGGRGRGRAAGEQLRAKRARWMAGGDDTRRCGSTCRQTSLQSTDHGSGRATLSRQKTGSGRLRCSRLPRCEHYAAGRPSQACAQAAMPATSPLVVPPQRPARHADGFGDIPRTGNRGLPRRRYPPCKRSGLVLTSGQAWTRQRASAQLRDGHSVRKKSARGTAQDRT